MSTWEALAIAVVVCSIGLTVLTSLMFFRALARVLSHADSIHDRSARHLESALDRIMAADFATFKTYQAAERAEEGEYIPPDEPEPIVHSADPGGFGSARGLRALLDRHEQDLDVEEVLGPAPSFTE